jgi:hypothetical protein
VVVELRDLEQHQVVVLTPSQALSIACSGPETQPD